MSDILRAKKIGRFDGYRTNAFFGFDIPQDPPRIHHFHLPAGSSKFVPVRRSKSYEDIFTLNATNLVEKINQHVKQKEPVAQKIQTARENVLEKVDLIETDHKGSVCLDDMIGIILSRMADIASPNYNRIAFLELETPGKCELQRIVDKRLLGLKAKESSTFNKIRNNFNNLVVNPSGSLDPENPTSMDNLDQMESESSAVNMEVLPAPQSSEVDATKNICTDLESTEKVLVELCEKLERINEITESQGSKGNLIENSVTEQIEASGEQNIDGQVPIDMELDDKSIEDSYEMAVAFFAEEFEMHTKYDGTLIKSNSKTFAIFEDLVDEVITAAVNERENPSLLQSNSNVDEDVHAQKANSVESGNRDTDRNKTGEKNESIKPEISDVDVLELAKQTFIVSTDFHTKVGKTGLQMSCSTPHIKELRDEAPFEVPNPCASTIQESTQHDELNNAKNFESDSHQEASIAVQIDSESWLATIAEGDEMLEEYRMTSSEVSNESRRYNHLSSIEFNTATDNSDVFKEASSPADTQAELKQFLVDEKIAQMEKEQFSDVNQAENEDMSQQQCVTTMDEDDSCFAASTESEKLTAEELHDSITEKESNYENACYEEVAESADQYDKKEPEALAAVPSEHERQSIGDVIQQKQIVSNDTETQHSLPDVKHGNVSKPEDATPPIVHEPKAFEDESLGELNSTEVQTITLTESGVCEDSGPYEASNEYEPSVTEAKSEDTSDLENQLPQTGPANITEPSALNKNRESFTFNILRNASPSRFNFPNTSSAIFCPKNPFAVPGPQKKYKKKSQSYEDEVSEKGSPPNKRAGPKKDKKNQPNESDCSDKASPPPQFKDQKANNKSKNKQKKKSDDQAGSGIPKLVKHPNARKNQKLDYLEEVGGKIAEHCSNQNSMTVEMEGNLQKMNNGIHSFGRLQTGISRDHKNFQNEVKENLRREIYRSLVAGMSSNLSGHED